MPRRKYTRYNLRAMEVDCDYCWANAGEGCRSRGKVSVVLPVAHASRYKKAQRVREEALAEKRRSNSGQ